MKKYANELAFGEGVDSAFSVKYKHPPKQYAKGYMFVAGLADRTGEIEATYWGGSDAKRVQAVYDSFAANDVVSVRGTVGRFRERLKIDINEGEGGIARAQRYEITDFVQKTPRDIGLMFAELTRLRTGITEPHLKALLDDFFADARFAEAFKAAPGAMYVHHACIGGLLEHTLGVAKICDALCALYPIDRSLTLAGAVLHDIGKTREFVVTTNIGISDEGLLRGHIAIGEEMVAQRAAGIPEPLRSKILHVVLSHHGEGENGSPQKPKFPEAAAVYYADELDSKIAQYLQIRAEADTENSHVYTKRLGQVYLR